MCTWALKAAGPMRFAALRIAQNRRRVCNVQAQGSSPERSNGSAALASGTGTATLSGRDISNMAASAPQAPCFGGTSPHQMQLHAGLVQVAHCKVEGLVAALAVVHSHQEDIRGLDAIFQVAAHDGCWQRSDGRCAMCTAGTRRHACDERQRAGERRSSRSHGVCRGL
jgi:hypothetical protein